MKHFAPIGQEAPYEHIWNQRQRTVHGQGGGGGSMVSVRVPMSQPVAEKMAALEPMRKARRKERRFIA